MAELISQVIDLETGTVYREERETAREELASLEAIIRRDGEDAPAWVHDAARELRPMVAELEALERAERCDGCEGCRVSGCDC